MSFLLTTQQVRDQDKTVTRRLGSRDIKVGDMRQPIVKGQGLKKGEHVERIGGPIRVVAVRREQLRRMLVDREYGQAECVKEGFENLTPEQFVAMFCQHNGCRRTTFVTRIEFEYLEARSGR